MIFSTLPHGAADNSSCPFPPAIGAAVAVTWAADGTLMATALGVCFLNITKAPMAIAITTTAAMATIIAVLLFFGSNLRSMTVASADGGAHFCSTAVGAAAPKFSMTVASSAAERVPVGPTPTVLPTIVCCVGWVRPRSMMVASSAADLV